MKANTVDVYNKSEIDDKLSDLNISADSVYTKTEIDSKISNINSNIDLKANIDDVYNKLEIDNKVSSLNSEIDLKSDLTYVDSNISTINSNIDLKANKSDIYNKSEIDSKISTLNSNIQLKANTSDVYNKNEIDNKISSLPTADNVYNKSEIDNKLSTINSNIDLKANTSDVYNKTEVDGLFNGYIKLLAPKQYQNYAVVNDFQIIGSTTSMIPSNSINFQYSEEFSNCDMILYSISAEFVITPPSGINVTDLVYKFRMFHVVDSKERVYPLSFSIFNNIIYLEGTFITNPTTSTNRETFNFYYYTEQGTSEKCEVTRYYSGTRYAIKF